MISRVVIQKIVCISLAAGLIVSIREAESGELFFKQARIRHKLPDYPFRTTGEPALSSLFSQVGILEQVNQIQEAITTSTQQVLTTDANGFRTTSVSNRSSRTTNPVQISRKRFHFGSQSLAVEHLRLTRPAALLYENGRFVFSGILSHDGGSAQNLLRSSARLRIRALSGRQQEGIEPIDSVILWEKEQFLKVTRNQPENVYITRVPAGKKRKPERQSAVHFDEVTHLEVILEYRKNQ